MRGAWAWCAPLAPPTTIPSLDLLVPSLGRPSSDGPADPDSSMTDSPANLEQARRNHKMFKRSARSNLAEQGKTHSLSNSEPQDGLTVLHTR